MTPLAPARVLAAMCVRVHISRLDYTVQTVKPFASGCVGFEARGLIFGAPLALALGAAFVPLRKPGKLPGETISEEYTLEYGSDKIEMHVGAVKSGQRVLLVDDLIATGGTMAAGIKLMGALRSHHE
jgi:adenine phosphoribosyltransferase